MKSISITIPNDDFPLIAGLLKRLGASFSIAYSAPAVAKTKLLETIYKGGDGKSIANPAAWQKEMRKDRNLPFK